MTGVAGDGWYRISVPVRFRDLDAMGHAHHTLPLIYLEEARAAFWRDLKGSAALDAIDYVLAEITLRFHARILYPDNLDVRLAVTNVGTKSFITAFQVRSGADDLLASGHAVQVAFDYGAGAAMPLAADTRAALEQWQRAAQRNSIAIPADSIPISPPST